jgi:hypothetical protein
VQEEGKHLYIQSSVLKLFYFIFLLLMMMFALFKSLSHNFLLTTASYLCIISLSPVATAAQQSPVISLKLAGKYSYDSEINAFQQLFIDRKRERE